MAAPPIPVLVSPSVYHGPSRVEQWQLASLISWRSRGSNPAPASEGAGATNRKEWGRPLPVKDTRPSVGPQLHGRLTLHQEEVLDVLDGFALGR
jgi:hypothetical protein